MNSQQKKNNLAVKIGVITAILALLVLMFLMLPKGFKDDLSLIGQGSVSVVLTHDKNLLDSTRMMEVMNKVRSDYEGKVQFLAVDVVTPVGQGFVRDQRVGSISLVIFGSDGQRLQLLDNRVTEQSLRATLDGILAKAGG